MKSSFILPATGSSITEKDISKGSLRIADDFEDHFPDTNRTVQVTINGRQRQVSFINKDKKSYLLRIGSGGMKELGLEAGDKLKVTIIGTFHYKLTKV